MGQQHLLLRSVNEACTVGPIFRPLIWLQNLTWTTHLIPLDWTVTGLETPHPFHSLEASLASLSWPVIRPKSEPEMRKSQSLVGICVRKIFVLHVGEI